MSTAAPVVRAGFTTLSSEPVRPDEGIEEVAHEGQPHGSSDQVFPHAAHDTPGRTGIRSTVTRP